MSQELEGTLTNTANLVGNFGSEGGGGTSNYNDLINKPSINSVTLQGNKTATQLGFAEVATSGNYNDLTNKPTIPAAQVNSDWNASSGVAAILNKPTIPAAQVNSDWNATSGVAEILNKPTIPAAQVNSDWNASSGVAQILNKPTIYSNAAELPISANDSTNTKAYIDTGLSGKADNEVTDISSLCTFNADWVLPSWGFYKVTKFGKIVQISVFGASYTGGISQATTLVTLPHNAKVNFQQIFLYGASNSINIASIDGGSNELKISPYNGDYIRLNMIIMVN